MQDIVLYTGAPPRFKSWGGPNRFRGGGVVDEVRKFEGGVVDGVFRPDEVRKFEGGGS